MPVGAIVGAVGSVAGGIAGGKGAKKAASIQAQSTREQLALQRQMFNRTLGLWQPDMQAGDRASGRIDQMLGLAPSNQRAINRRLMEQPGYKFRVNQMRLGTDAAMAARGMYNSGAALKALQNRSYNLADDYFNTYMAQLTDVANRGAGAKAAMSGANTNFANASAQIAGRGADAASNAALAQSQNFQNSLGGVLGSLGQMFPSSYAPNASLLPDVNNTIASNPGIF